MSSLLLHNIDTSRTGLLVRRLMGVAELSWGKVEGDDCVMPLLEPDSGTCTDVVLQIGRRFLIGWLRIAQELDRLAESKTFFPNGNEGMPVALSYWLEAVFRQYSRTEFKTTASENLFEIENPHVALISRQIHDERPFLQGCQPGLADCICEAVVTEYLRCARPGSQNQMLTDKLLAEWFKRMQKLGEGEFRISNFNEAMREFEVDSNNDNISNCTSASGHNIVEVEDPSGARWKGGLAAFDASNITLQRTVAGRADACAYLSFSPLFSYVRRK